MPDAGANHRSPTRVLVVEDEPLYRELLCGYLAGQRGIQVIGSVNNGHDALRVSGAESPDVVLVDIELRSQPDGIRTAHMIKAANPATGIVILTMHTDREYLAAIPERKAAGWSFLLKQSVPDGLSLVRAIEGAAWGLVSIDPALMQGLQPRRRSLLERLTQKQWHVLSSMASGQSDGAIARHLGASDAEFGRLLQTVYDDLHIEAGESLDQRVKAVLTFIRETSIRPTA
jgi:DNA-binding NarL/FixJ family response regulator